MIKIGIKELKRMSICPSGHTTFYQVIEDGKEYCMVCYALGGVHQFDEIKNKLIDTEFGKQIKRGNGRGRGGKTVSGRIVVSQTTREIEVLKRGNGRRRKL
ncbi:hypothetical protein ES703_108757 [subsurface metagenome]